MISSSELDSTLKTMLRLTWVGPSVDLVTLTDPGKTTAVSSTVEGRWALLYDERQLLSVRYLRCQHEGLYPQPNQITNDTNFILK